MHASPKKTPKERLIEATENGDTTSHNFLNALEQASQEVEPDEENQAENTEGD